MSLNRLITFLFFISPFLLQGQGRDIPINISLFNESTAIPFTRFFTFPVHPGIQAGTEFDYKVKTHARLFQTANIGYFYHNYLAQGIGLNSEFGYEYRFKQGLAFSALLGIGYMHTFATTEEFTFSDGQYTKKTDKGNARLYPSLSLEAGYYLNKTKLSPEVFIRYQAWAEYPYSPDFIPVMTHISLHLGAKFFIKKKNEEND
jgi:hypothetical protein